MKVNMKLHTNRDCKVSFEEVANFALHKVKGWIPSRKTYLVTLDHMSLATLQYTEMLLGGLNPFSQQIYTVS
ncbi:hypothetical protein LINGRAHAP2_LOCUS37189 [Linum grandiflorum]